VQIQVSVQGDTLRALVRDNGRGFDPEAVRRGNGLGSLAARARAMHGECSIESAPGDGTIVRFSGKFF